MGVLPENKRKVAKETPRNFVIYGGTMHGKTFFADEFPNPLNLNTDGNAAMIETPSLNIANQRNKKGEIVKSASDYLSDIILELETTNHSYQTVVIDVIDDVITMFEQEITEEHKVKSVGDIAWGKGHQMLEMMVRVLVMRLKELSMKKQINILYLSRLTVVEENDVEKHLPSLKLKWLNIVNGNSDYTILCRKIGKNYIRKVESKRKNYARDKVDDEQIASLLDTVVGAFDKSKKTKAADAKKIVDEQDKQEEAQRIAKQKEREQAEQSEQTEQKEEQSTQNNEQAEEKTEQPKQAASKPRPPRPVTK